MQRSKLAKPIRLLLFAFIACFYLWGLGSLPLVGPDEPRYAEVAREMMIRHDLITPTLGGLPWFEKPPLLYWMIIASYRLFGVSEYAARLPSAICGLITAVLVFWIGITVEKVSSEKSLAEEKFSGLSWFSGLTWLTSVGALVVSRGVSFDGVITMTLTGAFACYLLSQLGLQETRRRFSARFLALPGFYVFVGLSLLAKGLIGVVIPAGVIGVYFFLRRERPTKRFLLSLLWGLPLAFGVAAIWYGPMIVRHGWTFINQFIIQHHFARYATNKYHHPQPFYYYLPVLLGMVLPWTVLLVVTLATIRRWLWRGRSEVDRLRIFALAWLAVPLVFFSISGSKLPAYILPAIPAVALLIGERIVCVLQAGKGENLLRATGALLLILTLGGGWYVSHLFAISLMLVWVTTIPLAVVSLFTLLRPQSQRLLFLMIPVGLIMSGAIGFLEIGPRLARAYSVRDLISEASARGYGWAPVVQLHTIERTAEFYAADRLSYRPDGEPTKFEGAAQVADAARKNGVVLCLIPTELASQLTAYETIQTEEIGHNGHVSLIVVRLR